MEKGGQVVMTVDQADKPVPPARIMSPVASSSWSRPEGAVLRHRERARAVAPFSQNFAAMPGTRETEILARNGPLVDLTYK